MEHRIEPSEQGDYIVLKVVGELDGATMIKCIIEAHAKGIEMGVKRYLVDATEARNIDSVLGNYDFAYSDMKTTPGIDKSARVAGLVSPTDHSHDFVETLLLNAGLTFRLFTDPDAALGFLRE
jgi:hypothetical protein